MIASLTPPLVYWAASGAEQSLSILLTLVLVVFMDRLADERASWWLIPAAFVIAAMVFLTRPDIGLSAFAATGVLAVLALVTRRHSLSQRLGALAGSQVVLIVAISLARVSITGSALPQPLGAKVGTNLIEQISRGVSYVITNLLSPWFVVFVIVAAVILWRARPRAVPVGTSFLFLNALALLAGTTLAGGDWMELGRFFAAPATFLVIAVMSLTQHLSVRAFSVVSTILLVSPTGTLIVGVPRLRRSKRGDRTSSTDGALRPLVRRESLRRCLIPSIRGMPTISETPTSSAPRFPKLRRYWPPIPRNSSPSPVARAARFLTSCAGNLATRSDSSIDSN